MSDDHTNQEIAPEPITSNVPREKVDAGRNNYLTKHAGSLLRQGRDRGEIERQVQVINAEDCQPPLDHAEVAGIARKIAGLAHKPS